MSAIAPITQALVPQSVASGSPAAKKAYQTALGFEQILVNQLSQELAATASGSTDAGSSGDAGSSDTDSSGAGAGLMGSDPASSMYAQLLPGAMTSSVMSAGGLGIAQEIAGALDPTLRVKKP
jgi:hypothetical protein